MSVEEIVGRYHDQTYIQLCIGLTTLSGWGKIIRLLQYEHNIGWTFVDLVKRTVTEIVRGAFRRSIGSWWHFSHMLQLSITKHYNSLCSSRTRRVTRWYPQKQHLDRRGRRLRQSTGAMAWWRWGKHAGNTCFTQISHTFCRCRHLGWNSLMQSCTYSNLCQCITITIRKWASNVDAYLHAIATHLSDISSLSEIWMPHLLRIRPHTSFLRNLR